MVSDGGQMKVILVLMLMGMLLLVGCEKNDNGGSMEMDDSNLWRELPHFGPPDDILPESDFDVEHTARVLQEVLNHPVTEDGDIIGAIKDAGIRGVTRAELSEPQRGIGRALIIESEDNRIYRFHLSGSSNTRFLVDAIIDVESGKPVYAIVYGEG